MDLIHDRNKVGGMLLYMFYMNDLKTYKLTDFK